RCGPPFQFWRPATRARRSSPTAKPATSCATSGWCRRRPLRCWCSARSRPVALRCFPSMATASATPRPMPPCCSP
ncbi:hypothetical protein, partial [Mesorhizobium sp.]|uniref:hypothetical protein n=1 Tax=Mesorhizobium sp. TaxID=1871066 RepID=UPI00338DDAE4